MSPCGTSPRRELIDICNAYASCRTCGWRATCRVSTNCCTVTRTRAMRTTSGRAVRQVTGSVGLSARRAARNSGGGRGGGGKGKGGGGGGGYGEELVVGYSGGTATSATRIRLGVMTATPAWQRDDRYECQGAGTLLRQTAGGTIGAMTAAAARAQAHDRASPAAMTAVTRPPPRSRTRATEEARGHVWRQRRRRRRPRRPLGPWAA